MNIYEIRKSAYESLGKLKQLELKVESSTRKFSALDLYTERLELALFELVDQTNDIKLELNEDSAEILRFCKQYNAHITSENWFEPFVFEEKEN